MIIPGNFGGGNNTDLLFYRRSTGTALFARTDGMGNIPTVKQHNNWDRDWDIIITGHFSPSPYSDLLFYKRSSGEMLFASTNSNGDVSTFQRYTDQSRNWRLIVPGNFGNFAQGDSFTDLLFYGTTWSPATGWSGTGIFWTTDGSGIGDRLKEHRWSARWSAIIPVEVGLGPLTDLYFYNRTAGGDSVGVSDGYGNIITLYHNDFVGPNDQIVPGNFGGGSGHTDLLFYVK
jgi:hypothetical protein